MWLRTFTSPAPTIGYKIEWRFATNKQCIALSENSKITIFSKLQTYLTTFCWLYCSATISNYRYISSVQCCLCDVAVLMYCSFVNAQNYLLLFILAEISWSFARVQVLWFIEEASSLSWQLGQSVELRYFKTSFINCLAVQSVIVFLLLYVLCCTSCDEAFNRKFSRKNFQ